METSSLYPDHDAPDRRQNRNTDVLQNMQDFAHEKTNAAPRVQPINIVVPSTLPSPHEDHVLKVVQHPEIAKVAAPREKVRTPLDPPLVVELSFKSQETNRTYLCSPFFFGSVELVAERAPLSSDRCPFQSAMISGSLVSSLHKVRLEDNLDHAFFVFSDLNVKVAGSFRLKFTLFEMHKMDNGDFHAVQLGSTHTETFKAFASREFPGQMESTSLSKHLCDQGVKLRIRKETSKRKAQSSDWAADYYMHPHGPMSSYPRERTDPYHPVYGRTPQNDPRNVRARYSTTAQPDRSLPEIPTLPIGYNLPPLSVTSRYAAPPVPAPAPAFHPEPSLPAATRALWTPLTVPAPPGTPGWPPTSANEDMISYVGRREDDRHDDGNQSGLEHQQHVPSASRFSPISMSYQDIPGGSSHDRQYSRRTPIMPTYDQAWSPTRSYHHLRSFGSDADRSRMSAPSGLLPPIEPGPYRNEVQLISIPSIPLKPATASDARAVYSHQIQTQTNGASGEQEQKSPPRRCEPQT